MCSTLDDMNFQEWELFSGSPGGWFLLVIGRGSDLNIFYSFIQYKVYNDKLPKTMTAKHYITLQGRYQEEQKYHDYPLAFNTENINLKYN